MRVTLIHNPGAGRQGKNDAQKLVSLLEGAGHEVRYQSSKDDGWKKALKKPAELIVVARIYAGGIIALLYRPGGQGQTLDPSAEERGDEQHQAASDHGGYGGGLHVAAGEDLEHRRLAVARDERNPAQQSTVSNDGHGGDPAISDALVDALPAGRGFQGEVRERGRDSFTCLCDNLSPTVHQGHPPARRIGDGLRSLLDFVRVRLLDGARRRRRLRQRVILRVLAQARLRRLQPVQQDRAYREQHDEHGHRRHPYTKPEPHDRPLYTPKALSTTSETGPNGPFVAGAASFYRTFTEP